ncbi:MAG: cupin domain-containing protein [Planctomycetes bacterium]|nr:cupin domain-containing protein [Planctomycetota bacterium]
MQELSEGVYHYRVWRPGSFEGVSFNGTYLVRDSKDGESERVLIDPPPLNAWEFEHLEALGAPTLIVITNVNHLRAGPELRERFGARLLVPAADADRIPAEFKDSIDGTYAPGDSLAGLEVIGLDDQKTPGESALYDPELKLMILGDALIGTPGGALSLLPEGKFADVAKARAGLAVLCEREIKTLVLGDGESLLRGVRDALLSFFREVSEVELTDVEHGRAPKEGQAGWYVINMADAQWLSNDLFGHWCSFEGQRYRFTEVGVNVTVVNPGQAACLYHRETCQEGYFVLEGEATLLIEDEERSLRQWDYVHLPPGAAHVLIGAGEGPAAVLMLGARPPGQGIQYPRSETARRHGAGGEADFDTPGAAYGSIPGLVRPNPRPFTWPLAGTE